MRRLVALAVLAGAVAAAGCGGGAKVDKPEKPLPKFDMTPEQQKKAGDFVP